MLRMSASRRNNKSKWDQFYNESPCRLELYYNGDFNGQCRGKLKLLLCGDQKYVLKKENSESERIFSANFLPHLFNSVFLEGGMAGTI